MKLCLFWKFYCVKEIHKVLNNVHIVQSIPKFVSPKPQMQDDFCMSTHTGAKGIV